MIGFDGSQLRRDIASEAVTSPGLGGDRSTTRDAGEAE
jgi:hypothetical protein